MRFLSLALFILVTLVGMARAQDRVPAELPPADFAAAQYIDSAGCVFVRDGADWIARRDSGGVAVCGFPPSLSAWGKPGAVNPTLRDSAKMEAGLTSLVASKGLLNPDATEAMPALADDKAAVATTALRSHDTAPVALDEAAEPVQRLNDAGAIGDQITRELQVRPHLPAMMAAGGGSNQRLCELMGMTPTRGMGKDAIGDPTGGLCAGLSDDDLTRSRVTGGAGSPARSGEGARHGTVGTASAPVSAQAVPQAVATSGAAIGETHQAEGGKPRIRNRDASKKVSVGTGLARKPGKAAVSGDIRHEAAGGTRNGEVPPNARYVQLGRFQGSRLDAAIRAVSAMGYAVSRERTDDDAAPRIVVAGPFASRERLISALDHLRNSGFGSAFAR